jgi:HIRAN domain-containing protein
MRAIGALLLLVAFVLIFLAIRSNHPPARSVPFSELVPRPGIVHVRTLSTEVDGVSNRNSNGSSRQKIIRQLCQVDDAVSLIRELKNPVDRNTVQVRRCIVGKPGSPRIGEQLGYLPAELALELAPRIDSGSVMLAKILELSEDPSHGQLRVEIQIQEYRPTVGRPLGGPAPSGQSILSNKDASRLNAGS